MYSLVVEIKCNGLYAEEVYLNGERLFRLRSGCYKDVYSSSHGKYVVKIENGTDCSAQHILDEIRIFKNLPREWQHYFAKIHKSGVCGGLHYIVQTRVYDSNADKLRLAKARAKAEEISYSLNLIDVTPYNYYVTRSGLKIFDFGS